MPDEFNILLTRLKSLDLSIIHHAESRIYGPLLELLTEKERQMEIFRKSLQDWPVSRMSPQQKTQLFEVRESLTASYHRISVLVHQAHQDSRDELLSVLKTKDGGPSPYGSKQTSGAGLKV